MAGAIALLSSHPALAGVYKTIYAAPTGSGTTCSYAAPCSLTGARDKARTLTSGMTGDIQIVLKGGTYSVASPLALTESASVHDSGLNGYDVVWMASPGEDVTISGGTAITGSWTPYGTGGLYRISVPTTLQTRQVYVNGVRAVRARSEPNPAFLTLNTGRTGYDIASGAPPIATAGNPTDVEVYLLDNWYAIDRCGVSSMTSTSMIIDPNCFNTVWTTTVRWVENSLALLDQAGEWYLDRTAHYLYYKPRPGETMGTVPVVAATTEQLVTGTGTASTPLHNIVFRGIKFAYGTWLYPNDNTLGYPEQEDNFRIPSGYFSLPQNQAYLNYGDRTPANLSFQYAQRIRFDRDTFTHLGSVGLEFLLGSQENSVVGSTFSDISGSGVQFGEYGTDYHHPSASTKIVRDNLVADNAFTTVAQEYTGGTAVSYSYTAGTVVTRNDIYGLPYTGIWGGAGHGFVDPGCSTAPFTNPSQYSGYCAGYNTATPMTSNRISYNRVENVISRPMNDGGGIYTEGSQPDSLVHDNNVLEQHNDTGQLYLDAGTEYMTFRRNVVRRMYGPSQQWLYVQRDYQRPSQHNTITGNWVEAPNAFTGYSDNSVTGNIALTGALPSGAQTVVDTAGLATNYAEALDDRTYNVDDLYGLHASMDGYHGGINWGTGAWQSDDGYPGYASTGYAYYASSTATSAGITLPAGMTLRSVRLEGIGNYTISNGSTSVSGTLPGNGSPVNVTTGWTTATPNITMSFSANDNVLVDQVVYGLPVKPSQSRYAFDDLAGSGTNVAVSGSHGGIGFGTNIWRYDDASASYGLQRYTYLKTPLSSGSITLPASTFLRSVKLEGTGTYTISDGVNATQTGTLSGVGSVDTLYTNWTRAGSTVTFGFSAPTTVVVDDLVYAPAQTRWTHSFEDQRGQITAVNGVHGGINFGSGVWTTDHVYPGYELTTYAYLQPGVTSATFTLPAGTILRSIRIEGPGNYTLSDGTNTKNGTLSGVGTPNLVTTNWSSGGATVTLTITDTTGAVVIDDITYG